jgi:hypothetical protein
MMGTDCRSVPRKCLRAPSRQPRHWYFAHDLHLPYLRCARRCHRDVRVACACRASSEWDVCSEHIPMPKTRKTDGDVSTRSSGTYGCPPRILSLTSLLSMCVARRLHCCNGNWRLHHGWVLGERPRSRRKHSQYP